MQCDCRNHRTSALVRQWAGPKGSHQLEHTLLELLATCRALFIAMGSHHARNNMLRVSFLHNYLRIACRSRCIGSGIG